MAYAFSQINDLMDGENQNQSNIFGGGGDQQSQNQVAQTNPEVKTSTEGELSGGGSGGGGSSNPMQGGTGTDTSQTQANKAAFKANVGKTQKPKVFEDIGGQLESNQKRLQDEANSYTTAQNAKQNYAIDNKNLDKAIGGDKGQWDSVRGLLTKTDINPVDQFKPTDIDVRDAANLNTNAGLKSLVSRGQDPNFTSGMAAFDLAALRKSPGFGGEVRGLQSKSADLQKQLQDLSASAPQSVSDYGAQQLSQAQAAAKGYLGNQSQAMDKQNESEALAANKILQKIKGKGDPAEAKKFLSSLTQDVKARLAQVDPYAADLVSTKGFDARKYQQVHGDYGAQDFVSADEAQRFNSIMGLLGDGRTYSESQARGPNVTYDKGSAGAALYAAALKAREGQKTKAQSDLDMITKGAQERADLDDKRRGNLNVADASSSLAQQALQGSKAQDIVDMINELNGGSGSSLVAGLPEGFDASKYYTPDTADRGAQDVYSADEATKLNELAKLLGSKTTYQAGSYTKPSLGSIDQTGMFADLRGLLGGQLSQRRAAEAAAEAERQRNLKQGLDQYGTAV